MKKVSILSGVSGSGKSTYAAKLLQEYVTSTGLTLEEQLRLPKNDTRATAALCSADMYFVGEDGTYNFDPTKLGDAHGACFREFIRAVQKGCECVIVDNTNTTAVEVAPYVLGAQAYGYDVKVYTLLPSIVLQSHKDRGDYATLCAARNRHGVRFEVIMSQLSRLMSRDVPPWWNNTFIERI